MLPGQVAARVGTVLALAVAVLGVTPHASADPADTTPPVASAWSPPAGAQPVQVAQGQTLTAEFACSDPAPAGQPASGVTSCTALWGPMDGASSPTPVAAGAPLPTADVGTYAFAVSAVDAAGNQQQALRSWEVVAPTTDTTPPVATVEAPFADQVVAQGLPLTTSYSCTDDAGPVARCSGPVATGGSADTSTLGEHRFSVLAVDTSGNTALQVTTYDVVPAGVVTVSGHLRTAAGDPVPSAVVTVLRPGTEEVVTTATADGDGDYTLDVLQGVYDLDFAGPPGSALGTKIQARTVDRDLTLDVVLPRLLVDVTVGVDSPSGATRAGVTMYDANQQQVYDEFVNRGQTYTRTVVPGDYSFGVREFDETSGQWFFNGTTTRRTFTDHASVQLSLPVHPLTIHLEDTEGAPVTAVVRHRCADAEPAGWQSVISYGTTEATGSLDLLVADQGPVDRGCRIRIDPEGGPVQWTTIGGGATEHTFVVGPGLHVTGTLVDLAGDPATHDSGRVDLGDDEGATVLEARPGADGTFDLDLAPGTYALSASVNASADSNSWSAELPATQLTEDTVLDLAPELDPLTVHVVDPQGEPATATGRLACSGTPAAPTKFASQSTVDKATGTDLVLQGSALATGGCSLQVTPATGVPLNRSVVVPDGGGEVIVEVDPGITVTGQVSVPGVTDYSDLTVSITGAGGASSAKYFDVQPDGTFTAAGVLAVRSFVNVAGTPSGFSDLMFQRTHYLTDGMHLELAPELDPLDLYLLGAGGTPGTGTARLRCQGSRSDDSFAFQLTDLTRPVTAGQVRLPGYAAEVSSSCLLVVTWTGSPVMSINALALDPDAPTPLTLISSGEIVLPGSPTESNDGDNVGDATEAFAANTGDGNDDGTADYEQGDVASLPVDGGALGEGDDYLTVAADGSLTDVSTTDVATLPDAPPPGVTLPAGLTTFTVTDIPVGSTRTVTFYPDSTTGLTGYAKYDADTGTWTELPEDRVAIFADRVEVTLTDGGIGDDDGAADGSITDPGGVSVTSDTTDPVVTGTVVSTPNDAGWYADDVVVEWDVTDDSGPLAAPPDTTVTGEGADLVATSAEACDAAGNCATGHVTGLKIDRSAPSLTLGGPAAGTTYPLGSVPAPTCAADDALSGLAADCAMAVSGGLASGVGRRTVTASVTDLAGNTTSRTLTYVVVYRFAGFQQPINQPGSKLSVFKKGSTVSVRFKLAVAPTRAPVWLAPRRGATTAAAVNEAVSRVKPDRGGAFRLRSGVWEYRWSTASATSRRVYRLGVRLDDGTVHYVNVAVR